MTKTISIILMTSAFVLQACGNSMPTSSETLQATPEPEFAVPTATVPVASPTPVKTPALEGDASTNELIPVPGLRVLYLRGGNLWSWTDASGNVQLTDTGDMTTICVSGDSQRLAFMRGNGVWTVRMDGTDVRLWDTQAEAGGRLSFAPDGNLLAISTRDHIDLLDLTTTAKTTVLIYAAIPDGYFPEVIWTPDSSGFKTVIPAPAENEKSEMLFVFTNGTVASLAKFAMNSVPFLAPDGGYVIYVGELGEERQSLFLMDSSGATLPYGEMAATILGYGWLPDAKRFVYGSDSQTFLGNVGSEPVGLNVTISGDIRWVNDMNYLALQDGVLTLGDLHGANIVLDSDVSDFDAVSMN